MNEQKINRRRVNLDMNRKRTSSPRLILLGRGEGKAEPGLESQPESEPALLSSICP